MANKIRVTVWNEYRHEKSEEHIRKVYPEGIHAQIASFLKENGFDVTTATLDEPEHGLTAEVLENTDVLIWWGHMAHDKVPDKLVEKIHKRVLGGMGLVVLHSGHHSKIFRALMGTTCNLRWRDGDRERIWNINPNHPIAKGIPDHFSLNVEEMYGEQFDIPAPEEIIFLGWFSGGEVFRSGCTWRRGLGKIFYFQPGHESNPTFHNEYVQRIIINAVRWANPINPVGEPIPCPHKKVPPEEKFREELAK